MAEGEPNPAEQAAAAGPEAQPAPPPPPEEPPESPPEQPPQPRVPDREPGFWGNLRARFQRGNPAVDRAVRRRSEAQQTANEQGVQARRLGRLTNPEAMVEVNTPEEIQKLLAEVTAVQWRERQIQERYGRGIRGNINAFLAGERSFEMDENGEVQRNAVNEIIRKATYTLFNRKTLTVGASMLAIGLLTGGVGIPAAGALFGAAAGRGIAEAWHSLYGRERGLREEQARAQYRQWFRLKEQARVAQELDIDDDTRNQRIADLVDGFHQPNQEVLSREKEIVQDQGVWNRRRNIGSFIGGVAGLGVGILAAGGLHQALMTMHIHGGGPGLDQAHHVERIGGAWNYLYNSAQEAATAAGQGGHAIAGGAFGAHALGESTARVVLGAAGNLANMGSVFGGLWLGRVWEKRVEAGAEERENQRQADLARRAGEERKFTREQIPPVPQEGVEAEEPRWLARFTEKGKPMPEVASVWVIAQGGGAAIIRINSIDFANGTIRVTQLNPDMSVFVGPDGRPATNVAYNLEALVNIGNRQQEYLAEWLINFNKGDRLSIRENTNFVDEAGRAIPPGEYIVVKIENKTDKVILRRPGQEDIIASVLALAVGFIRRFEPERGAGAGAERAERVPNPRVNERWQITNRDQLPDNLRERDPQLPEIFVIQTIDLDRNRIDIYDAADPQQFDSISLEDWQAMFGLLRARGAVRGGGGGKKGGGGGGGAPAGGGTAPGGGAPAAPR